MRTHAYTYTYRTRAVSAAKDSSTRQAKRAAEWRKDTHARAHASYSTRAERIDQYFIIDTVLLFQLES